MRLEPVHDVNSGILNGRINAKTELGLTSVITLMAKESAGGADATNQMEYVPINVWQPEGRLKTVSILMRKVSQKSNEISVCFNL